MVLPGVNTQGRSPRGAFGKAAQDNPSNPYVMKLTASAKGLIEPRAFRPGQFYVDSRGVIKRYRVGKPDKDILGPKHVAGLKDSKRVTGPAMREDYQRLYLMIEMRDLVWEVLDLQQKISDSAAARFEQLPWTEAQNRLKEKYEFFVRNYGPIKKEEIRQTGRLDEYGDQSFYKTHPNAAKFRKDPDAFRVLALIENYNAETEEAAPGDIFQPRLINPERESAHIQTLDDALAECLSEKACVDIAYIAEILERADVEVVQQELEEGGKIFFDPASKALQPASQYLTGNVFKKLSAARKAAKKNPDFEGNVTALERVMPKPLGREHVNIKLGMHWIPKDMIRQFAEERLGLKDVKIDYFSATHTWFVTSKVADRELAHNKFGTASYSSSRMLKAALSNRIPKFSRFKDGGEDVEESQLAQLRAEFQDWVWNNPKRSEKILKVFNEKFNVIVPPAQDDVHRLRLPGTNINIKPRDLQNHAVSRGIEQGNTLFAHAVGAGKTLSSIFLAMELKRLGKVQKPCFVLPLNMMDEFPVQCMRAYPQKNILVLSDDDYLSDGKNKTLPEKIAGLIEQASDPDIDAIFMPQSVFDMLSVSPQTRLEFAQKELANLEKQYASMKGSDVVSITMVSHVETLINDQKIEIEALKIEAKYANEGSFFEETKIDCLIGDEVHAYKKLSIDSKIEGMSQDGSKRADNLDEILRYLRTQNPDHHIYTMTATPISNSLTEVYTWLKFMSPDLMEEMGLEHFDAFLAMFGDVRECTEIAPEGDHLRKVTRLADWQNMPVMMRMFHANADIAKNLIPKPDKKEHVIWLERNPALEDFFEVLKERAGNVRAGRVKRSQDNMLKIIMEGRLASLDPRLVGIKPDPSVPTKLEFIADRIAETYHAHKDEFLVDKDGNAADHAGVLQGVMCDLAVLNGASKISAYAILKEYLIERGLPHNMIDTVHNYQSPVKKADLMHQCNTGQLGVVEGTTQRLGTGSNMQKYLKSLYHADIVWRAMDMIQRNGRIERPGNLNGEIDIFYPIVKDTFDAFMWQTVRRKQAPIDRFMNYDLELNAAPEIDPLTALCDTIWEEASEGLEFLKESARPEGLENLGPDGALHF